MPPPKLILRFSHSRPTGCILSSLNAAATSLRLLGVTFGEIAGEVSTVFLFPLFDEARVGLSPLV